MPFIKSKNKVNLFYQYKEGNLDTLVFIHGWNLNHTIWKNMKELLEKKGYGTLVFDLRGHGKTSAPSDYKKYKMKYFIKDLNLLIKKLKIKKPILVGHSFGGMILLRYLRKYKHKCKKVVLIDTTYRNPFEDMFIIKKLKNWSSRLKNILSIILTSKKLQRKYFKEVDFSKYHNRSDFFYFLKGLVNVHPESTVASLNEMLDFNEEKTLNRIKIPALIIEGEKDYQIPRNVSEYMDKKLVNSKLKIIKGASHNTPINHWKDVFETIYEFIQKP